MRSYQKLLFSFCLFIALFIMADFFIGSLMGHLYYQSRYGVFCRQIYCLTESKEEILVLGSSRAAHHYVPSVIGESFGLNCYNAGSDGMCIYYHYAILASYLSSGRIPKLIIYDVNELDLLKSSTSTFTLEAALDRLAPHYNQNKNVDSLFALKGWTEKLSMHSLLYRYNSKLVQLIKCNFIPSYEDNGYEAVYGSLPDSLSLQSESESIGEFEESKKIYVEKMFELVRRYNVPLVLVYSPIYKKTQSVGAVGVMKEMANRFNIPFMDMSNEDSLMNPLFFKDVMHLNDEGAHRFSELFVEKYKKCCVGRN